MGTDRKKQGVTKKCETKALSERQAKSILRTPLSLRSMPKAEARMAIARDVIAALRLKKMKARTDLYFHSSACRNRIGQELRPLLPKTQCQVCAIGGLFTAIVARVDNFHLRGPYGDVDAYDPFFFKTLTPFFPRRELNRIEAAFEGTVFFSGGGGDCYFEEEARFGRRFHSNEARMIGIMKNIIQNGGYFRPDGKKK